ITSANAAAGADTIVLNIGGVGTVQTIALTSALSTITGQVSIDGWSQGGVGYTGTPLIILDGNNVAGNGLTLSGTADGSLIRGFVIRDFTGNGISIQSGSDSNTIVGNYIGGMTQLGVSAGAGEANSGDGINILGANNIIGGIGAGQRNVISNNGDDGIDMDGIAATGNLIIGNYIGTTAAGTVALGNASNGIEFGNGASNNTVGGAGAGQGNLISGNTASGIRIDNNSDNNTIQGNLIGTDAVGTGNLGNGSYGIDIRGTGSAATSANNILIGGTAAGQGNIIAFSGIDGVRVTQNAFGVQILGNSIHSNIGLGIDLEGASGVTANDALDIDTGANNLQNYPVLTSAQIVSSTQVNLVGSLNSTANSQFRIEFFSNTAQDGTGFGEGQTYLGFVNVTTDGSGNAIFNTTLAATVSAGNFISATATKSDVTFTTFTDTSEFAQNRVVPANTAPTLDASKSPALTAINEDAGAPVGAVGTLVSSLVDFAVPAGQVDNVTDPNSGALLGLAVTAADTTNGTWFYSTNNGASWNALGAVANNNARLLAADANTRLYFQPNANYNGTLASAITFRAWDQTSGSNGTLADASTNGGTTAFSTATDTAALTVTAVNDAPTITALADQTIAEDGTTGALAFTVSDVETAAGSLTVTATSSNPALIPNGNLTLVNLGGGNWTIAATPALNQFGGPVTITVTVNDGTTTTNETFDVTVTAVNDAPTITALADQTIAEDGTTGALAFTVSDVETAAGSLTVTATSSNPALIPNGNLTLVNLGGGNWTIAATPAL
ncbi:MAG: beta strand repeat-containing protein, partial [Nitrospiraceae bacterium]